MVRGHAFGDQVLVKLHGPFVDEQHIARTGDGLPRDLGALLVEFNEFDACGFHTALSRGPLVGDAHVRHTARAAEALDHCLALGQRVFHLLIEFAQLGDGPILLRGAHAPVPDQNDARQQRRQSEDARKCGHVSNVR